MPDEAPVTIANDLPIWTTSMVLPPAAACCRSSGGALARSCRTSRRHFLFLFLFRMRGVGRFLIDAARGNRGQLLVGRRLHVEVLLQQIRSVVGSLTGSLVYWRTGSTGMIAPART